jgi:hypothetical protein
MVCTCRSHALVCFIVVVGLLLHPGQAAAAAAFRLVDLGPASEAGALAPYACTDDGRCADHTLINAFGQVVLSMDGTASGSFGARQAYFWESTLATRVPIGRIGDTVVAVSLSSNGWVVGTSDSGVRTPFLWSRATGMRRLSSGSAGGDERYRPLGVNSLGAVVGTRDGLRAVLWSAPGALVVDLNDLEIAGGGPWEVLEEARAISDQGWILGVGRLTGVAGRHVFLLIPTLGSGAGAIDRSDWTASATEHAPADPPRNAIDGTLTTRFSTGTPQHDSQGFSVAWPGDRMIGRIRLELGASLTDYPRSCGIWITDTAGNVEFEACTADEAGNVEVAFAIRPVHLIEVWQWGVTGSWWSIAEVYAYEN